MNKRAVIWVAVSSQRQAEDERISLPFQESEARAWCAKNGYDVTEVLKVEGHSRSDPNIVRLLNLYEKKGVTAYARLQELWASKGFDVLVAYSSDRLGRSSALINFVIETTYYEGMQVCLTNGGGLMERNNFRMPTMLGAAQATMPMDAFKEKTREAKAKLAAQGLITGNWPMSHRPVRDPDTGKTIAIVVNEESRPLLEAIATLLIEGRSWASMSADLAERWGFLNANGQMHEGTNIRRFILNAWVFGHNMTGQQVHLKSLPRGRWIFDRDYPPPNGIQMFYDVIPPVFEGERMEQLKAELRRRFEIRGRSSTLEAHRFARLCVCDECGHLLSVHTNSRLSKPMKRTGYICPTSRLSVPPDRRCPQRRYTSVKVIQAFVEDQLKRYLAMTPAAPVAFVPALPPTSDTDRLSQEIGRLNARMERLMNEMSLDIPDTLRARYRKQIAELNEEIIQKESSLETARTREATLLRMESDRNQTIEHIRDIGLDEFWQLPDPKINQWLLRFFGDYKIAIRDKAIIALRKVTRGKR